MSNELNLKSVVEALVVLDKARSDRRVNKLIEDMEDKRETHPDLYLPAISRSSVFRILKSQDDPEALLENESAALRSICQYVKINRHRDEIKPSLQARIEFAANYLNTRNARYHQHNLKPLAGCYDMYRRFWRARDKNLFMRSRVRIKHFKRGHFLFFERQHWEKDEHWPNEPYQEINRGFLFPSGQSIIAICEALGGENTKYFTVNDFEPSLEIALEVQSFSGSAIASSDVPPHPGYGFHCVRSKSINKTCKIIDIRDMKHDILKKILINENYVIESISDINRRIDAVQKQ